MIEQGDWILVGIIVAVTVGLTLVLSSIVYAQRVYDVRVECQKRIGEANREIIVARQMLADTAMQRRVMGSVPVSRLIEGDSNEV